MQRGALKFALVAASGLAFARAAPFEESAFVQQLVQRSIEAMEHDWQRAPEYVFLERDIESDGRKKTQKTQRVWMIEGSPYYECIESNGEPLSPKKREEEQRKLKHEVQKRRHESPSARSRRIAQYNKERQQDHALM